jgi:hypothetical protein
MHTRPIRYATLLVVSTLVVSCGGDATAPDPDHTTTGTPASITFAGDSVLLDQRGDTATLTAQVKDAQGNTLSGTSLSWTSDDAAVATIAAGKVSSVRVGRTLLKASVTGTSVQATIPVRVVLQRNSACIAPSLPSRGAASGAPAYAAPEILTNLAAPAYDGARSLAADFDGDGDVDVVRIEYSFPSSNPYSGTTKVFKNDGGVLLDSTSVVLAAAVTPDHARDFEVRDFTGDGRPDIYVAQHGYDASPFPGAPNLFFTWASGKLSNAFSTAFTGGKTTAFSHGSASADIDCDGDADLVELNLNGNEPNDLWINDGTGRFTAQTAKAPALVGITAGQLWQEVAFVDVDSDGDQDMFLGARSGTGWNQDAVLVNDGFGNFRRTTAITLPAPHYSPNHAVNNAKSADFDGDGRQDLVYFEIPGPFSATSAIRLLLNQGDGTFADASASWGLPATCGAEMVEPLHVGDFNGDGWPDVALPPQCPELGRAGILFNKGNTFEMFAFTSIVSWLEYDTATPMDVNADGKVDLFFGEHGGNPVVVKRQ